MDSNVNKIISFILGLVVVVVLLAILTGRINLKTPAILSFKTNTTPTPSPSITPTPTKTNTYNNHIQPTTVINQYQTKKPGSIPSTGSPTLLLPLIFSAFAGGAFLSKTNKKS